MATPTNEKIATTLRSIGLPIQLKGQLPPNAVGEILIMTTCQT